VSYRDELDAAHARIQALETDLSRSQRALDEARGGGLALEKVAPSGPLLVRGDAGGAAAPKWLGAPVQLRFERELEGEVPVDAHTEMIERMRRAFGVAGATTVLPGSLAWSIVGASNTLTPTVNIYVSVRNGRTRITLEQRLTSTVGAIYGGIGGGVGGGGVMLPIAAVLISPFAVPVAIAAWLGGTYAFCRRLFRSRANVHAERLDKLLDELAAIAAAAITRAAAAKPEPSLSRT
jgi:hypothetical protein